MIRSEAQGSSRLRWAAPMVAGRTLVSSGHAWRGWSGGRDRRTRSGQGRIAVPLPPRHPVMFTRSEIRRRRPTADARPPTPPPTAHRPPAPDRPPTDARRPPPRARPAQATQGRVAARRGATTARERGDRAPGMGRSSQLRARNAVLRWPPFAPEPKPASPRRARECPTRHHAQGPSPPASSPSSCRAPSPRWGSNPSGRTRPASGATASTRCARTSRASPRRWPMPSSPATRGRATSSSTPSAAAARPRSRRSPRDGSASATTSTPSRTS